MKRSVSLLLDSTCAVSQSLLTCEDFINTLVTVDSVLVPADADTGEDFLLVGPYGVFGDTIRVENDHFASKFAPRPAILKVTGILVSESGHFEIQPRSDADLTVRGFYVGTGSWDQYFAEALGPDGNVDALATEGVTIYAASCPAP